MNRYLSGALNDWLFTGPDLPRVAESANQPVQTEQCPTAEELVDAVLGRVPLGDTPAGHAANCHWCQWMLHLAREEAFEVENGLAEWPTESLGETAGIGMQFARRLGPAVEDSDLITSATLSSPAAQAAMEAAREQLQETVEVPSDGEEVPPRQS